MDPPRDNTSSALFSLQRQRHSLMFTAIGPTNSRRQLTKAANSNLSSIAKIKHENAFQAIPLDTRMATQHGSTYSGANRTQNGNIIQVNSINARSVQIGKKFTGTRCALI